MATYVPYSVMSAVNENDGGYHSNYQSPEYTPPSNWYTNDLFFNAVNITLAIALLSFPVLCIMALVDYL